MASVAGLSAVLIPPAPASACSQPSFVASVRDTPANGVVIVDLYCPFAGCFESFAPEEVVVVDTTTNEVLPGAVVHIGGDPESQSLIAWRPDVPLVPQRLYQASMPGVVPATDSAELPAMQFHALAAVTWSADDIEVRASVAPQEYVSDSVHCEPSFYGSCIDDSEIELETSTYVALRTSMDSPLTVGVEGQLLVSAAMWSTDGDNEPPLSPIELFSNASLNLEHRFDDFAESYCYRIKLTSMVDDSEVERTGCVDSTLTPTTTRASENTIIAQLALCRSAPDGFLEQWCASKRDVCADDSGLDPSCADLQTECADVPSDPDDGPTNPQEPMDPMDPDDAMDPAPMDPDDSMVPMDPSEDMEPMAEHRTACTVSLGDQGNPATAAVLTLLATALYVRRSSSRRKS